MLPGTRTWHACASPVQQCVCVCVCVIVKGFYVGATDLWYYNRHSSFYSFTHAA